MTGPSGRSYERGSPSNATSPVASAASGGRKRITVPAFPTSTFTPPRIAAGLTNHCSSCIPCTERVFSVIPTPSARKPATINSLSRETNGRRRTEGESACAAKIRARLVTDFDPGITTEISTGCMPRKSAGQCASLFIIA